MKAGRSDVIVRKLIKYAGKTWQILEDTYDTVACQIENRSVDYCFE